MDQPSSITDVGVFWPDPAEVIAVLTLQAGLNSAVVVAGAAFLGVAAGIVGTFAMLRGRAMMSDALAHSTLPGLAAAFLVSTTLGWHGKSLPVLLSGAAFGGVLGVLAVRAIVRWSRLSEDTAIGAVLSVFFGVGILLLSVIQNLGAGGEGGLTHFIYGQTAALQRGDAELIALLAAAAMTVAALLLKEFRLVCFDPEFAAIQGWPVRAIDFIMMALIVVVTVIGLQAVGILLVVAMLIIPPCAARFWSERLNTIVILAGVIGALSGYLGASASALLPRLPAGAVIVLVAGALFLFSFFCAPRRGIAAAAVRLLALRARIGREHLLRGMYETFDVATGGAEEAARTVAVRPEQIHAVRSWPRWLRSVLFWMLRRQGLLVARGDGFLLTDRGLREAARLTRNHRLWEEYLIHYGDADLRHVDYSADFVEHILSAELVEKLEAALLKKGRSTASVAELPPSIHPLEGAQEVSG